MAKPGSWKYNVKEKKTIEMKNNLLITTTVSYKR